jgi:hypothetical protein
VTDRSHLRLALAAGAAAATAGLVLTGCGGGGVDSGGLSSSDRKAAQNVLDTLQNTSIPTTLVSLTATAGLVPQACRVHLESRKPSTFKLFVFWKPYVPPGYAPATNAGADDVQQQSYSWIAATIGDNVNNDTFHLGHAPSALPRAKVMASNAGNVFSKPGARCQVLQNGYLRLLPNQ